MPGPSHAIWRGWGLSCLRVYWGLEATHQRRTPGQRPVTSAAGGSPRPRTWPFGPGEAPGAVLWGGGPYGRAAWHPRACTLQLCVQATCCCRSSLGPGAAEGGPGEGGPKEWRPGRWQLQGAGFQQTAPAAWASRVSVWGAGTGSLNNWLGPEPGTW